MKLLLVENFDPGGSWQKMVDIVWNATLAGVDEITLSNTGGVAALNHRLMAWNPPGSTPRPIHCTRF